jgi:hypothetical protein
MHNSITGILSVASYLHVTGKMHSIVRRAAHIAFHVE